MSWHDYSADLDPTLFRMYSSTYGRWMSPDPLAGDVSNPQSLNRYAYVLNNPTNLIDPLGLKCVQTGTDANGNPIWKDDGTDPPCGGGTTITVNGGSPPQAPLNDCAMAGDGGASCQQAIQLAFPPVWLPSSGQPGGTSGTPTATPAANNPTKPTGCQQTILNAVNNQTGNNFTGADVQQEFPNGNTTNLIINGKGLSAAQFNSIQTGRYPLSPLTWLTGYGPTLHITGQTYFDPYPATFSNNNIGGITSVQFTAHIDGSFAYNPFGAVLHGIDVLLTDLGLVHHNTCP